MTTILTHENLLLLEAFLHESGAFKGMKKSHRRAVFEDLYGLVTLIVAEAVSQATDELKVAAIMAGMEALDNQQSALFANVQAQYDWPQ